MGLEVFAATPRRTGPDKVEFELAPAEAFATVPQGVLAVGPFSGHPASFRGSAYVDYLLEVAGVWLPGYGDDPMPPEVVKHVADALQRAVAEERFVYHDEEGFDHEFPPEAARALAEWFRCAAEGGYCVLVWV